LLPGYCAFRSRNQLQSDPLDTSFPARFARTRADRLEAALKERRFEALIDRSDIYPFEDWWQRIQGLIAQCDTVIFVLSPDAVASPTCIREIDFAASLNKRFAPLTPNSLVLNSRRAQRRGALPLKQQRRRVEANLLRTRGERTCLWTLERRS
jgi:hypothetical protein